MLALSWSGETAELADLIDYAKRFAIPLIARRRAATAHSAGRPTSCLELPQARRPAPTVWPPTTSTTIQLVLGDALAVALIEGSGFSAQDFRLFHPGGKLGARLHKVDDLMHSGLDMPLLPETAAVSEAILTMTGKRFGCVGLSGRRGSPCRHHHRRRSAPSLDRAHGGRAARRDHDPRAADGAAGSLASSALETMNRRKITVLFIVEDGRPAGVLHIHDLLRAGVA